MEQNTPWSGPGGVSINRGLKCEKQKGDCEKKGGDGKTGDTGRGGPEEAFQISEKEGNKKKKGGLKEKREGERGTLVQDPLGREREGLHAGKKKRQWRRSIYQ